MTFWGVEIFPWENVVLQADKSKGKVYRSVGGREPFVNLCSLRAEKNESYELDLDFDEDTDVYFSVDGPLSVHLTGYYREKRRSSKNGKGFRSIHSYASD
ncbi:hypothetical protein MKX01_031359 [Papaver californicum]|nr:hypothetical protein MKX01_031359 [Papaver californicum]